MLKEQFTKNENTDINGSLKKDFIFGAGEASY